MNYELGDRKLGCLRGLRGGREGAGGNPERGGQAQQTKLIHVGTDAQGAEPVPLFPDLVLIGSGGWGWCRWGFWGGGRGRLGWRRGGRGLWMTLVRLSMRVGSGSWLGVFGLCVRARVSAACSARRSVL